jgi:HK97 family phage portal protein
VQQRVGQDEWQEIAGHPLRRLLMRPNDRMDEAAFLKACMVSSDISGRRYIEIVRQGNSKTGLPVELHPLDPAKVSPIPRDDGTVDYQWKDGNKKVIIPSQNMLVHLEQDPTSPYQALAPLAVALGSVDADSAQTDYVRAFFNNAGVPSGILKVKAVLTQEKSDDIKAQWRAKYGRQWGTQHDVAVLDENADYTRIGSGLNELDNDTLREFVETRVCMVFGVPPLIIYAFAGLKRATYSNLREAWPWFWASTLTPWFKDFRTWLTWSLLPQFVNEELIFAEKVRLNWDMSQVAALQDDVDAAQNRARANFQAGMWTLNEARAATGEQEDPAGDAYLRSMALVLVPRGEQMPQPAQLSGRARPEVKRIVPALKAAAQQPVERRMAAAVQTYLDRQYAKAVEA